MILLVLKSPDTFTAVDSTSNLVVSCITVSGIYPSFTISSTDTTFSAGTGLSLVGTTFNNTAPDQTVTLTGTGATTVTGTYPNFTINSTNITYTVGTGLSLVGTNFTNTAPDQIVSLTGSGATTVTGTYPNFTISSTDTDTNTTYTAGTGLSLVGTTFNNTAPDQTVTLTGASATTVTGTYPNFTISSPFFIDTNTTYSAGTGITLAGTTFSIGQSVGTSDSPSFNQVSLGVVGTNQGIFNLKDLTNVGTDTIAQIKGLLSGSNGGEIKMFIKKDSGGSLTERLTIAPGGLVSIKTNGVGLAITSEDGVTEQGYIYSSGFGTKDFTIEAAVGSASKGIQFRTNSGTTQMRIDFNGNVGIGTITPSQKLEVSGAIKSSGNGVFSVARLGDMGYGTTYAGFAHDSLSQPNNYALLQDNLNGTTYLNSSAGTTIRIRVGNAEYGMFDGGTQILRINQYGFYSIPGVTNTTVDALIFFIQFNGIAYWWCRNSANQGGLIQASFFGATTPSDDRLKFNETPIQNGINLVKQMNPMFYDQIESLDADPSTAVRQCGFIADEIEQIPGLEFLVEEQPDSHYPENNLTLKALRYNGVMTVSVQALKEVIGIVETQQTEITRLNNLVTTLERRLNSIAEQIADLS